MSGRHAAPAWLTSRRELLRLATLVAGASSTGALAAASSRPAGEGRRMLERVCAIVIPATDTPGAVTTGVADFVELALRHGLDGTRDPGASAAIVGAQATNDTGVETQAGAHLLRPLKSALDAAAGGDFLSAPAVRQETAVATVDAAAFRPGNEEHPWHKIKDLILLGYYTSEIGGSKELRYELVPGRWDPDVPVTPATRAFSSDWTAVEFG